MGKKIRIFLTIRKVTTEIGLGIFKNKILNLKSVYAG